MLRDRSEATTKQIPSAADMSCIELGQLPLKF